LRTEGGQVWRFFINNKRVGIKKPEGGDLPSKKITKKKVLAPGFQKTGFIKKNCL